MEEEATSNKGIATGNPGVATRSKDATRGPPGLTSSILAPSSDALVAIEETCGSGQLLEEFARSSIIVPCLQLSIRGIPLRELPCRSYSVDFRCADEASYRFQLQLEESEQVLLEAKD